MDIQRKKRKKRKVDWYIVLTPVFAVVALTAMLACFCTIGYYQVKEEKAKKEAEEAAEAAKPSCIAISRAVVLVMMRYLRITFQTLRRKHGH